MVGLGKEESDTRVEHRKLTVYESEEFGDTFWANEGETAAAGSRA